MAIPMLKDSFFGCCTLKTGSKIIAWISVIISVLFSGFLLFIYTSEIVNEVLRTEEADLAVYIKYGLLDSFITLLLIIASIFNVIGVNKERAGYIKPWLICVIISLFEFTREVLLHLLIFNHWTSQDTVIAIIGLTIIGFTVYSLLVEYSYYRVIRSKPIGSAALV